MPLAHSRFSCAALSALLLFCAVGISPLSAQTPDFPKPTPEIQTLIDQARPLRNANKLTEAETLYQQALEKARLIQDKPGEAMAMGGYAMLLQRKNLLPESLKMLEQALALAQETGAKSVEAAIIQGLGSYFYTIGKPLVAAERFEEARKLFRLVGDKVSEAGMMMNLGVIYDNTGQVLKAIPIYQEVLPIFRERNDKNAEASVLTNLGIAHRKIDQYAKAKPYEIQALRLFRELGNKESEANCLIGLSVNEHSMGNLTDALKLGNEALAIAREGKNVRMEGLALKNLAMIYRLMGQMTKALEISHRALQLVRETQDIQSEVSILNDIAVIYSRIGEPQKAMALLEQALPIYERLSNKIGILSVFTNLGYVCSDTLQFEQAAVYFRKALALATELSSPESRAGALNGLAMVAKSRGNYPLALRHYQEALGIYRAQKLKEREASLLGNMGNLLLDRKKYAEARIAQLQALALYRQVENRNGIANTLHSLGEISRMLNRPHNEQVTYYQQSLNEARATGNRQYIAIALRGLAETAQERKSYPQAIKYSAEGIALREDIRTALGGYTAAQSEFLSGSLSAYSDHLALLLEAGRETEAFAFAQKLKARILLDTLAYGRVDLSSVLTEAERKQEQALRETADGLNERMIQEGVKNEVGAKKRFAALKAELKAAEQERATFTAALYARHPELVRRRVAKTTTLAQMAKLIPADTALLEYVMVNSKTVCLFVVTTERGKARVRAVTLPVKATTLQKQTAAFRLVCSDPRKAWKPQARALYTRLIAPAVQSLRGKKRLIICPDGVLWDVPFAALLKGKRTLRSRYVLSSAYSATGVQAAHGLIRERKWQTGSVLIVANPDFGSTKRFGDLNDLPGQRPLSDPARPLSDPARPLSDPARPLSDPARNIGMRVAAAVPVRGGSIASLAGTQREASAIKALFPGAKMLTKLNAQEKTVKAEANKFRYLHFATHGFVNDAAPMLSSVVLAQPEKGSKDDGFLTAREVYDLTLNAEMTVLSACNSGRGETRSGEGIVGLTWALLCAGCPTQVVSQWSVDDAATALLMGKFYANLKAGQGISTALRNAAQSLRSAPKYRHPYYWAAFVVMGEGK